MAKPVNPICLALDSADPVALRHLADQTRAHVGVFKIGLTAFAGAGPGIVASLSTARPVFVDLKLHDIPAQVAGTVGALAGLGASYTTVHALGGEAMIRAAVESAGQSLAVLAVTVLTSMDDDMLAAVGVAGPAESAVLRLVAVALDAGAHGLVCSAHEVEAVRAAFGTEPLLVVPGIRFPPFATADDQRRVATPARALEAGADLVVVGRPVTGAADPAAAACALLADIRP
ncbi:MAG: orotidine-5'-phosphate decarboxylase [Actinomycetota bacterium]